MNNFQIKLGIEPTDKYEQAKQNFINAIRSWQELTPQQRQQLATEIFGCEAVAYIQNLMQ